MADSTIELPTFKGRPGWEFTDISGLDLAAYERALPASLNADPPAGGVADAGADAGVDAGDGTGTHSEVKAEVEGGVGAGVGSASVAPLWSLPEADLPAGVLVTTLDQAPAQLGSLLSADDDVFVALNDAGERAGTLVYVPRGVVVEQPISIGAVQARAGTLVNQRTLIVLEEGARAEVWEQFLSGAEELDGVFNIVTELIVGAGAHLRYVCGQSLSEESWIFGAQRAEVGRDGGLDWVALGFGSARGHVRMETRLAGDGAEARVTGAYATRGRQHIDFDTTQEHAAPNTTSDLAFRGVLQDRSSAVWKGNIIVDPGAQKTDAFQESRNLLLSKRAHADAIPGLEIQANDVRCTHAAAVAQVDPEQLFYLRSRGLPEPEAKQLVIEGFLAALVERFEEGPVRDTLGAALEHRLALVLG